MCGIFCAVTDNQFSQNGLDAIKDALRHRGPDEQSEYQINTVRLAFCRLSIVDVSGGQQPIFSEDQDIAVICNGEIYNYRDLRRELSGRGHRFKTKSDAEVIVHLYQEDPIEFVKHLEGMFAFIIVDSRRNAIILGRDRFGIKPLVYHHQSGSLGKHLVAASEIKAILASGLVNASLEPQSIFDSFTFDYIPGDMTAFKGIKNLLPGCIAKFDLENGSMQIKPYWRPHFSARHMKGGISVRPVADKLYSEVYSAVARHTIGDVPIASYLSGGIDSTAISFALAKTLEQGKTLTTFSIFFREKEYDESESILKTSRILGFDNFNVQLDSSVVKDFQSVISMIEQPQFVPLDLPIFHLSKLVRNHNIKVVLAGEGSDELLGGYWSFTLNQIRRALSLPALKPIKEPALRRVLKFFVREPADRDMLLRGYLDQPERAINHFGTFPAWFPLWKHRETIKRELFVDGFRNSIFENEYLAGVGRDIKTAYSGINDFDKGIYLEMRTRLPNYILHRADRNSMAHSVEARLPFLDDRLAQFIFNIAPLFKMYGVKEKYALRKAFTGRIPSHVTHKRKFGYNAPNSWIWDNPTEHIRDMLSESNVAKLGIFQPQVVTRYLKESIGNSPNVNTPAIMQRRQFLTGVLSTVMLRNMMDDFSPNISPYR